MAVLYGGVKGLSDTSEGGGDITDVICKLDGWYWEVVEFGGVTARFKGED